MLHQNSDWLIKKIARELEGEDDEDDDEDSQDDDDVVEIDTSLFQWKAMKRLMIVMKVYQKYG